MEMAARNQIRRTRGGDAGKGMAEIVGGGGSSIAGSTTMADGGAAGTGTALRGLH